MPEQTFKAKLKNIGTWVVVIAPFDTLLLFGTKKHVRIKGTIDQLPFTSSLMPMGNGKHFFPVKLEIRKAIHKKPGDVVEVQLKEDTDELKLPRELKEAFKASPEAKKIFGTYSYSHQKEYVTYVQSAKKAETRIARAVESVLKLERLFLSSPNK